MANKKGLYDYRKFINSENACYKLIRKIRWPTRVRCPRCGFARNRHFNEKGIAKHQCKKCNYKFSDLTGTIFHNTKLPLTKWILAIGLFNIGISANQLSKEINVSYRIAWNLMHKLRDSLKTNVLVEKLTGKIEIDETYFGGRISNKSKKPRFSNKSVAVGIRQRNGKVKTIILPKLQSHKLKQILREYVDPKNSIIYSDDFLLHRRFKEWGYSHKIINKVYGYVIKPDIHTNSIEGYWMLSKKKLYARHHKMSGKYLPKYIVETDHKYNSRNDLDPIDTILKRLIFTPLSV